MIVFSGLLLAQKPEQIYSFAKVSKSHKYYLKQAELWWKEIEKDSTNEEAWYNYWRVNRNCKGTYKNLNCFDGKKNDGWNTETPYLKEHDEIISLIEKNIPNTFTYYRLQKMGNPHKRLEYLLKAFELNPNEPEMYDAIITAYEMQGNTAKRKEFNELLYKSNYISPGFIAYANNVLVSMKPNAILLTFGDNDTYPAWLLQDALDIRTDVTVLNVPLITENKYRKIMFKKLGLPSFSNEYEDGSTSVNIQELVDYIIENKPADNSLYIGLPAWKQMKEYEDNLYLIGLALEYTEENIDNIALLKNNFENKYALDYLNNSFAYDISAEMVDRININYLPGIFKLYEHYTLSGDLTQAQQMKELGLIIAKKGGQDWLNKAVSIFE